MDSCFRSFIEAVQQCMQNLISLQYDPVGYLEQRRKLCAWEGHPAGSVKRRLLGDFVGIFEQRLVAS